MLTVRKSIASRLAVGALLCTLISGETMVCFAANDPVETKAAGETTNSVYKTSTAITESNSFAKSTEAGVWYVGPVNSVALYASACAEVASEDAFPTVEEIQVLLNVQAAGTEAEKQNEENVSPQLQNMAITTAEEYQNIRAEASEDAEIVGRMYAGCAGEILEETEDWIKISSGEVTGWVYRSLIVSGEEAEAFAQNELSQIAVVDEDGVRVRSGASVDAAWIGVAYAGESYVLLEADTEEAVSEEIEETETEEAETAAEAEETAEAAEAEMTEETQPAEAAESAEAETEGAEAFSAAYSAAGMIAQTAEAIAAEAETTAAEAEETAAAEEITEAAEKAAAETQAAETADDTWVKIRLEDGTEGYIRADFVTVSYKLGKAKSMETIREEERRAEEAAEEKRAEEAAKAAKEKEKEETSRYEEDDDDSYEEEETSSSDDDGWVSLGEFKITSYCGGACCNGKWAGTTASGVAPSEGRTIAVAPWIIPYGSQVKIEGLSGVYTAEDTGGFAKRNPYQIDLFIADHARSNAWGVCYREVWIKR